MEALRAYHFSSLKRPFQVQLILLLAILGLHTYGQKSPKNENQCITLEQIFKAFEALPSKRPDFSRMVVADFDFESFSTKHLQGKPDQPFEIGYYEDGRIASITSVETMPRLGLWRIELYYTKEVVIGFHLVPLGDKYVYTPGIFAFSPDFAARYYLNIMPQFGDKSQISFAYLERPRPIMSNLSAIMTLSREMYPNKLIRIDNERIALGSEMVYGKLRTLDHEVVYFFDIPLTKTHILNGYSCVPELFSVFEEGDALTISAKPRVNRDYLGAPLWIWKGSHLYE